MTPVRRQGPPPGDCRRMQGIGDTGKIPGSGAFASQKTRNPNTSLYRITRQVSINPMQNTEKKIKIIRDKLSRIGIGEKSLTDEAILSLYSINQYGNLCGLPRILKPAL